MFLSEQQVNYLVSKFMPRVKVDSKSAMIDVACDGMSILRSARKYGVTHQSLSKNLLKLKDVQKKIRTASDLLPSSYLLKENAHALLMADVSFLKAKIFLSELCESIGGNVDTADSSNEIKLYLDGTVTCIFLNPDESYEREWSYDHNDAD